MKNSNLKFLVLFVFSILSFDVKAFSSKEIHGAIRQAGGAKQFLAQMTKSMAEKAPLTLDSETTLISAVSTNLQANIDHQLVNIKSKSDWKRYQSEERSIASYQRNKLCTADVWSILLKDYQAEAVYRYYAKNGELLFSFFVTKNDCKRN